MKLSDYAEICIRVEVTGPRRYRSGRLRNGTYLYPMEEANDDPDSRLWLPVLAQGPSEVVINNQRYVKVEDTAYSTFGERFWTGPFRRSCRNISRQIRFRRDGDTQAS
ncbi:MAG: hypothetical protein HY520_04455 [Candidatus Aenigmarchaeota archaeon]|nr:hypothetical protein [Candidatus Aenigmarchaeota archaeon]